MNRTLITKTAQSAAKTKKKTSAADVMKWIMWSLMLIYALSFIAFFGWIMLASIMGPLDFILTPFSFPKSPTFDNYSVALSNMFVRIFTDAGQREVKLLELIGNSLLYVFGCAIVATMTPCIVAYAAAKFKFKFNRVLDGIVIVTMILPIIGNLPAEIQMARALGFYGTFYGMFFMRMSFLGFNYLLFKSAFKGVPDTFSEAARVDGASHLRILVVIMLPMVVNMILIVFLIQAVGFWMEWQVPMIYLPQNPTVAFALFDMQFTTDSKLSFKPVQLAACIMASIPTTAVFIIFRKKLMGGLAFGGLKG